MSNKCQEYDRNHGFDLEEKKEKKIRTGSKGKAGSIDELISRRVKTLRLMSGLNQEKLGEALGISTQQIQKYEKGTNRISSGRLFYIAQTLNVPVSYFFEEIDKSIGSYDVPMEMEYKVAEEEDFFLGPKPITDISDLHPNDKEVIECVRAFSAIPSRRSRKRLIDLMKSMTADEEA